MADKKFPVKVKPITGPLIDLNVDPKIKVYDLKVIIMDILKLPVVKLQLIFKAKKLEDEVLLSEYVNEPNQTIHLVLKTEEQVLKELQVKTPLCYDPETETRPRRTPPPKQKDGKPVPTGTLEEQKQPNVGQDSQLPFVMLYKLQDKVESLRNMTGNQKLPRLPLVDNDNQLCQHGVYLETLHETLSDLIPVINRIGSLLHHQKDLKGASARKQTQDTARNLGQALQQLSVVAGSVGHFYEAIELGDSPAGVKATKAAEQEIFKPLIQFAFNGNKQAAAESNPPVQEKKEKKAKKEKTEEPAQVVQVEKPVASAAPEKPILSKIGEKFNQLELMKLIKGDFAAIENFGPRVHEIAREVIGTTSIPEFVKKVVQKVQGLLRVPDQVKASLIEDFDPCMGFIDAVEQRLPALIKKLLTHSGSDEQLVTFMRGWSSDTILQIFDDLLDGFKEGVPHLMEFFKLNTKNGIEAACEPSNAMLASMMGTPSVMKYIEQVWYATPQGQASKPAEVKPVPAAKPAETKPVVVQKPVETKPVNIPQPVVALNETLLQRCERISKADAEAVAKSIGRPLSRAYLSLDLDHNHTLAGAEAELSKQAYESDKASIAKTKPNYFKIKLRQSLIDCGTFPSKVIDEEMKKIDAVTDIPDALRAAYFEMQRCAVKARISQDGDYKKLKGSGLFEHLDKL